MKIIRASLSDMEDATLLLREYDEYLGAAKREDTRETIASFVGDDCGGLWLAYVEEAPAGCVVLRPLPSMRGATECKRLYVRPRFRRHGIAEALLDCLEERARAVGESWVYIETKDGHQDAIRIYTRRGYRACERFNDNPLATIFLRKDLRSEKTPSNR